MGFNNLALFDTATAVVMSILAFLTSILQTVTSPHFFASHFSNIDYVSFIMHLVKFRNMALAPILLHL